MWPAQVNRHGPLLVSYPVIDRAGYAGTAKGADSVKVTCLAWSSGTSAGTRDHYGLGSPKGFPSPGGNSSGHNWGDSPV
jgi:hypothetical protein